MREAGDEGRKYFIISMLVIGIPLGIIVVSGLCLYLIFTRLPHPRTTQVATAHLFIRGSFHDRYAVLATLDVPTSQARILSQPSLQLTLLQPSLHSGMVEAGIIRHSRFATQALPVVPTCSISTHGIALAPTATGWELEGVNELRGATLRSGC